MSESVFSINDPNQIPDIVKLIHDCFFSLDDITFDSINLVYSIKFTRQDYKKSSLLWKLWFLKKWQIPSIESIFKIHHVESYSVKDPTRVGKYNFIDLEYDQGSRRIKIITGIPINIELIVTKFEVAVEDTGKIVDTKAVTTIFDLRSMDVVQ